MNEALTETRLLYLALSGVVWLVDYVHAAIIYSGSETYPPPMGVP